MSHAFKYVLKYVAPEDVEAQIIAHDGNISAVARHFGTDSRNVWPFVRRRPRLNSVLQGILNRKHSVATEAPASVGEIEYREIEGYPDYRVGNDGSVYSHKRGNEWRKLKPGIEKAGSYRAVHLVSLDNKSRKTFKVHRLVLEAFVGPCPPGKEALHGDGNPGNNRLDNLRWGTRIENAADRVRHGRQVRGTKSHMSRLTENQVRWIRQDAKALPISKRALAEKYGITLATLLPILRRTNWKHVEDFPEPGFEPFTWAA